MDMIRGTYTSNKYIFNWPHSDFKANYATYPVFLVFSRLPSVFNLADPSS